MASDYGADDPDWADDRAGTLGASPSETIVASELRAAHKAGERSRDTEVKGLHRMMRGIVIGIEESGPLERWMAEVIEIDEYLNNDAPEGKHNYQVPPSTRDPKGTEEER